jgi:2-keto-4-pentenoate hydratase/2-oxohepta-3-ene-1,7-dioic acid hydratase in catechol pathway
VKIARYAYKGSVHYGRLEGENLVRLSGSIWDRPDETGNLDPLDSVRLLSPIESPRIFGVGLNYVAHIAESGSATPRIPLLFMKPSTSAIGTETDIIYPHEGQNIHFEAELAVVIGRKCRRVPLAEALSVVFGYTCANDISERVIQAQEMAQGSLLISKGYDTFCPLGPRLVTTDELPNPNALTIATRLNGKTVQDWTTSDMIFDVPTIIAFLSASTTLPTGTVILTGTPHGVGMATKPEPRWLRPGDEVTIEIEGIGSLTNPVALEPTR